MKIGIRISAYVFLVAFSIVSVIIATLHRTEPMGESDDYMLATVAIENHFSIRITEQDVIDAERDFPEHAWYFRQSWEKGMPALFSIDEGEVYPWYMGTYSAMCIPVKKLLKVLGYSQSFAFSITNAIMVCVSLWACWFLIKASDIKKLLLIIALGISPIVGYYYYASAESVLFAFVVLALIAYSRRNYHIAGLLVSIAGTLNISIMFFGLVMIIDYTICKIKENKKNGVTNIFKIMALEKKSILLLILCYLPSLITPIFNLIMFKLLNLQSILGFGVKDRYFDRFFSYLFDLNIGFLAYFGLTFIVFLICGIVAMIKKKRSGYVYLISFLGVVALYSVTYHINSEMVGIPRYSLWTFPIMFFFLLIECEYDKKVIDYICTSIVAVSILFTFSITKEFTSSLGMTWLSKFVMNNAPELYSPYQAVFVSRVAKIPGGYIPYNEKVPEEICGTSDFSSVFPVVYCNDKGYIRKILTISEMNDDLFVYFEGDKESIDELRGKICNSEDSYYINLHGKLKIKTEYLNSRFSYTYDMVRKGEIPLTLFKVTNDSIINDKLICLNPGDIQYGPYLKMKKGKYRICIDGSGLEHFQEDVLADGNLVEICELEKTDGKLSYTFKLEHDVNMIEIRGTNNGNDIIQINSIVVE